MSQPSGGAWVWKPRRFALEPSRHGINRAQQFTPRPANGFAQDPRSRTSRFRLTPRERQRDARIPAVARLAQPKCTITVPEVCPCPHAPRPTSSTTRSQSRSLPSTVQEVTKAATPRSNDRGPIEARFRPPLPPRGRGTPRSNDRGPIEASHQNCDRSQPAGTPRSNDRGPIEARLAPTGYAVEIGLRGRTTPAPLKRSRSGVVARRYPDAAVERPRPH